jgi:uncharacterized cupin superfamily protein
VAGSGGTLGGIQFAGEPPMPKIDIDAVPERKGSSYPQPFGDGHHLINRSGAMAVYLEIGSRRPADLTTCSDIDMMSANADGRFRHKDGAPYPERQRD